MGLSAGGDAISSFNAGGELQANVTFEASDSVSPYPSFDNAAFLNNTVISLLSATGVNGAFVTVNDAYEIGSPGRITAVPEPEGVALKLAGYAMVGAFARKRLH